MVHPSELDHIVDQLDVQVSPPSEYPAQAAPVARLLPEAYYTLKITAWDFDRDRETKAIRGNKINIHVVVVGGDQDGRKVRNLAVWTVPYQYPKGSGKFASGLGNLITAIDSTFEWHDIKEAAEFLNECVDKGLTFRARLAWEAYDNDYFVENGGRDMQAKSDEQKALRKMATVKGMRNFPQNADGTYEQKVTGPSGSEIEAKLVLDRYIKATDR